MPLIKGILLNHRYYTRISMVKRRIVREEQRLSFNPTVSHGSFLADRWLTMKLHYRREITSLLRLASDDQLPFPDG